MRRAGAAWWLAPYSCVASTAGAVFCGQFLHVRHGAVVSEVISGGGAGSGGAKAADPMPSVAPPPGQPAACGIPHSGEASAHLARCSSWCGLPERLALPGFGRVWQRRWGAVEARGPSRLLSSFVPVAGSARFERAGAGCEGQSRFLHRRAVVACGFPAGAAMGHVAHSAGNGNMGA